ncbi:unnamed protein product [Clonostachys rhizophaga]|uniref:Uncharacterized protein n=1 Tax=Clonostachys rhizophaga TaxID=160324 RepID=A0A9N9YCI7_9HYPO|nr:unnamed protein product [Clonostachys rhizophaga]
MRSDNGCVWAHTPAPRSGPDRRPRDGFDLIGAIKPGRLPCVHDIAATAINRRLDFAEKPTSVLPLAQADMQLPNRVDVAQGQEPECATRVADKINKNLRDTCTYIKGQSVKASSTTVLDPMRPMRLYYVLLLSLSSRFGDPAQSGQARAK